MAFVYDCFDLYEMVTLYYKSPFVTLTKVNKSIVHLLNSTFANKFLHFKVVFLNIS